MEKQLLLQEKNSDIRSGSESVTPAAISRSLYERVLNRQVSKIGNQRLSSSETSYVNGPGRAQFEGLDDIPEVKNLRRSQKPQYVTIERSRSVTSLLQYLAIFNNITFFIVPIKTDFHHDLHTSNLRRSKKLNYDQNYRY